MLRSTFDKKAAEMGDFYVYYTRKDTNVITFAVATADLNNNYIRSKHKRTYPLSENEVLLWSWTGDNLLKLDLNQVKKLVPLSSVLKNGNQ